MDIALKEPHKSKANILIVDDEESMRLLLKQILSINGFRCALAASAAEGRKWLRKQPFDLVLSDIRMPQESGLDFIRHVVSAYQSTATILVSVIDDTETADVALEIGVYGYIVKPFHVKQVLISVKNALRQRLLEIENREYRQSLEKLVSERTAELNAQSRSLEDANAALRVLLKQRERDKQELEEKILLNVKELVLPFLESLKGLPMSEEQRPLIRMIESNLESIISPFLTKLSTHYFGLSPTEMQIASLIKDGKTTKEIADLLGSSVHTVVFHRNNIRKKLHLKNKRQNLRSYMLSMEKK